MFAQSVHTTVKQQSYGAMNGERKIKRFFFFSVERVENRWSERGAGHLEGYDCFFRVGHLLVRHWYKNVYGKTTWVRYFWSKYGKRKR